MQTFKVLAPFSTAWHGGNMATLKSVLRRQLGVNFQWKRERERRKKEKCYIVGHYNKARFTIHSLYYPVCSYERVKLTSLFIKPFWVAPLLASADSTKAGITWQKWIPSAYRWSTWVILEAGLVEKRLLHIGVLYCLWALQTSESGTNA